MCLSVLLYSSGLKMFQLELDKIADILIRLCGSLTVNEFIKLLNLSPDVCFRFSEYFICYE